MKIHATPPHPMKPYNLPTVLLGHGVIERAPLRADTTPQVAFPVVAQMLEPSVCGSQLHNVTGFILP